MGVNLTINGNTYTYPSDGDEPGWGSEATAAMQEVVNVLNNIQGADDISETTFTISNNVSSATDVTGLIFSPSTVRSAVVDYSIYRSNSATFATTDVDIAANTITIASHVLTNGTPVMVTSTTSVPGGLATGTVYYVVGVAANTFQLAATLGGTAIDLTSQGTGTHTISIELAEKGKLELVYKNGGPVNNKWNVGRVSYGDDCGVVFTMTDAGQIKYTSTQLHGSSYSGTMRFEATVTQQ